MSTSLGKSNGSPPAGIGASALRLEDPPLLRGEGSFLADLNFPHQLHMRVVRSDVAFGKIKTVTTTAAKQAEGVAAVWVAEDVAELPPIDFRQVGYDELRPYLQSPLAAEQVRYAGDPVAALFAADPYLAEDAAELVWADVEPAPAVINSRSEGAIEAMTLRADYGDVDSAMASARRVDLYGIAKVPHYNCATLAKMLRLPEGSVVGKEGHVGGGFGVRGELYPEDVLVVLAALRLGRPVKWVEDRREHLIAANHSRDQFYELRAAVDADGVIQAIDADIYHDQGAYVRTHGATVPSLSVALLPGPYRVPSYRARGHIRLTNKTPAGTYRAPGRFESTFARERLLDVVASEYGLDAAEVRRRNLIAPGEMPFDRNTETLGTHVVYDSGDYGKLLERLLTHIDYEVLKRRLGQRRAAGELVECS